MNNNKTLKTLFQDNIKAFLNCNRQTILQELYENNFQSDWKNIPNFVTKVKLRLLPQRSYQPSKSSSDSPDGTELFSTPTEMTFNILHMVIILRKDKILRLLLDKMGFDAYEVWLHRVKVNFTNIDRDLEKSWIYSANSLHLAAKFNPEALHLILSHLKDTPMKFKEKFTGLHGVTPLHVAAMNSDSISAR